MDCPNCHTWNPDDKIVCWRCQTVLPKPVEKKKKQPIVFLGLPLWAWVALALMIVFYFLTSSFLPQLVAR
jgi:predicted nucleic acid-binding Zn ribbon protein